MTAVCGRDGQWTPNPGGVTCSYVPPPTSTQTFSQAAIPTQTSIPTGPGENEHFRVYCRLLVVMRCGCVGVGVLNYQILLHVLHTHELGTIFDCSEVHE